MIYADNAATTKMSRAAIDTMTQLMQDVWGNPSSLYGFGQKSKEVLEAAREDVAHAIGAEPKEIIFTSGGSEADNQAIRTAAYIGKAAGKNHIISSAFEHHAVLHTLSRLEKEGFTVTLLDVHETAYEHGNEWYEAMLAYVGRNIDEACTYINENIPHATVRKPEGTYLIWVDLNPAGLSSEKMDDIIINKAKLWLDSGKIFGKSGEGFQRINAACPRSVLFEALDRLRKAL